MNYGQLKDNITGLGFADEDELEEFGSLVPNAINRAITEISMNYAPIISYMDIEQPMEDVEWDGDALYEYPMPDDFLKFEATPVKRQLGEGIYQRFNDFEIEGDNTVILSGAYEGVFRVFYVADHEPFTLETDDEEEIPLPLKAHYLVPLLASYYIWLDDDQTKAQEYLARYQLEFQNAVAESEKPRARIRVDWGGFVG